MKILMISNMMKICCYLKMNIMIKILITMIITKYKIQKKNKMMNILIVMMIIKIKSTFNR